MKALKTNDRWRRGIVILASLWLAGSVRGLALPMTAVQGVVYRADGSPAQGTLLVSWPAFTASDGSAIAAGNATATIAADGTVNLSLTPNAGARPQGTYYTVVYHLNDGTVSTEYWVVPQAATATIAQMRAKVVPAAVAQQTVSQQYVDSSISAIQANYLQLQGGTMSGALNLSGDPAGPLQAATKQYVDAHAAANLPANAIPFQGSAGTQPIAATPANIAAPFSSTAFVNGQATTVACAGYLNSDGSCSMPGSNVMAATDGNGHLASLPEMGTVTRTVPGLGPVTSIAWHDDFGAGLYDPRDPRWGPQDTPAHQAAALQAMSNRMACDLSMGVVSQAVAKFPQGMFYVDQLQMAPGSVWMGAESASAGTQFRSFVNNHQAAQMPISLTVTCSDGNSHTDSKSDGVVAHFFFQGCAQGGCANAAGDTPNYQFGGPGNVGMEMSNSGRIEHVNAQAFGGYGIRVDGMDTKAFHLRTGSGGGNDAWYYWGGYKGVTESAASAEANATTTGSTGSVALSWPAVPGAAGYVVYRGSTSGGENNAFLVSGNSFTDTCATGAAGILGTVTNVVTNSLAAPGAVTATASATGGTCTAGTYYYKITATQADGWHGSVELTGGDVMADWVESYGQVDDPTVYTYHHLADIVSGGGGSHFDHFWPQLGQVGIAQPLGLGINDKYENVRIDFTRLEGMWVTASGVWVHGGLIQGSCKSAAAPSLNTQGNMAGTCNQFFSNNGSVLLEGVQFANPGGFAPYYSTADILNSAGVTRNTSGSFQVLTPGGYQRGGGQWWEPTSTQITNVTTTGDNTLNVGGLRFVNPADTTPVTYFGFVGVNAGQDFYVKGGNGNITLHNNGYLYTCSGQDIHLGDVTGFLHFVVISSTYDLGWGAGIVQEVCDTRPVSSGSETVTFSATPTFSTGTRASIITLAGNVTSFTLAAGADGQEKTLTFCQNATGGFSVAGPANVRGLMTVGTTANKCSSQHFTYSTAQGAWLADSAGVANE